MKTDRGEALETFILLSLPRYKSMEQRMKRAEEMAPKPVTAANNPEPSSPPSEDIPPPIKVAKSKESKEEEEETPILRGKPHNPPRLVHDREQNKAGKALVKTYRKNQIRKLLHLLSNNGSDKIVQLPNLEELINSALSQTRKPLANEEVFYDYLKKHNLSHFVTNRHRIARWYKNPWYSI